MEMKYFDKFEFRQALDIIDTNPLEAKIRYEKYLEKYPKDYSAYPFYASILITLGDIESANKVLEYARKISTEDQDFANEKVRIKHFEDNIIFSKLRMLSYLENYDELYTYILENIKYIDAMGMNPVLFYCRKKLGMLVPEKREKNSYLFRQITEYRESDFLEHIQKHMADFNSNLDNPNPNIFVSEFPINQVLEEIKKHIPSNIKTFRGIYDDEYTFKYNNCGRANNKLTDYFKVVCFHNTQEFITMLPVSETNCSNLPYIDLNYLIKENKDNPKTKKISQIDKFNKKYGNYYQ